jgi:flavin-dependent dehydrogenase
MPTQTANLYKSIPKVGTFCDVIVAGGGPAGVGAAIASALNGAKTLVLEARSQFGGTATAAMWMDY